MLAVMAWYGRSIALFSIMALASLLLGSCSTIQMRNIADPGEFARNLFRIAGEGDAHEWGTQLTAERRAMGESYAVSHFDRWRKTMLELKTAFAMPLENVQFRVSPSNGLEFNSDTTWHLLLRVKVEDGGLKINQD